MVARTRLSVRLYVQCLTWKDLAPKTDFRDTGIENLKPIYSRLSPENRDEFDPCIPTTRCIQLVSCVSWGCLAGTIWRVRYSAMAKGYRQNYCGTQATVRRIWRCVRIQILRSVMSLLLPAPNGRINKRNSRMSADKGRLNVFVCANNKLYWSLADIIILTNEWRVSDLIFIQQTKRITISFISNVMTRHQCFVYDSWPFQPRTSIVYTHCF